MIRLLGAALTLAASAALTVGVAAFQPPEGGGKGGGPPGKGGKGDKKGGGMGKKGFQLGWVLPPHVKEQLDLTPEQEKKVEALEKDVKAKLEKILTPDQIKRVGEAGPPMGGPPGGGPGGGPPDGKGGPPGRPGGDDE